MRNTGLAGRLLLNRAESPEVSMKFSREFTNEREAEAREHFLKAAGYQAWRKHTPDDHWHVFWVVPATR
jgi:hypothetical protein